MRASAPGRLRAMERAHARAAPNAHQLDGGAMFRALLALGAGNGGTPPRLDSEGEAKRALAQVAYMRANPLPDNSTTNQFDARVNEFDTHVNPALEMQYTGENYVKLLLESCVPACLETDGRLLRREMESSFVAGTSGPTRMTDEAYARAVRLSHSPRLRSSVVRTSSPSTGTCLATTPTTLQASAVCFLPSTRRVSPR